MKKKPDYIKRMEKQLQEARDFLVTFKAEEERAHHNVSMYTERIARLEDELSSKGEA